MTQPISDLKPRTGPFGQRRTVVEFAKYILLGGANFFLSLAVFALGTRLLMLHYILALVLAWFVGIVFMYVTNSIWVFKSSGPLLFDLRFRRFLGVGVVSVTLNSLALHLLVQSWDADPFWAQIALLPMVVLFNFAMTKYFSLRAATEG